MQKGIIFNIQKFCLHDGPGVRTAVFVKGCPLRCKWCSNPESQSEKKEIILNEKLCIGCGSCAANCPNDAIRVGNSRVAIIDRSLCSRCGSCASQCPTLAVQVSGKEMSVNEIIDLVESDRLFYQTSGGGITISGGEPLFQPSFLIELLGRMKKKGVNTAIETSGMSLWEVFQDACPLLDWVLFDIKHLDNKKHMEGTGVTNDQILDNLSRLSSSKRNIVLRVPLIPKFNMSESFYEGIIKLVNKTRIRYVNLLPYHRLGRDKYKNLGRSYELMSAEPQELSHIIKVAEIIENKSTAKVSISS
jgi:pyruvate formate lyase activating enzyme